MNDPRKAEVEISFNGKNVDAVLTGHLEDVSYEDIAKDASDTLDITIENIDMKWISKKWYPKTGDLMQCSFKFLNWANADKEWTVKCGRFTLDDISFSGNNKTVHLSGVALPASSSFSVKERTKTWEKITIRSIGKTIAERYKLKYSYSGPSITISSLEQDEQTDMEFMYRFQFSLGFRLAINDDEQGLSLN